MNWTPSKLSLEADAKLQATPWCKNEEPCLAKTNIVWTIEGARSLKEEKEKGVRALREVLGEGGQSIFYHTK